MLALGDSPEKNYRAFSICVSWCWSIIIYNELYLTEIFEAYSFHLNLDFRNLHC